jgi:hypothetical protein
LAWNGSEWCPTDPAAATNNFVTGGSFTCDPGSLVLNRSGLSDVVIPFDLSCIEGTEVETLAINCNTDVLTLGQSGTAPDVTVDLSCIDNQCLTTPSLVGTILTTGIEDCSTDVTVDLAGIQKFAVLIECDNGQFKITYNDGSVQSNAGVCQAPDPCGVGPLPPCTAGGTSGCPCVDNCSATPYVTVFP